MLSKSGVMALARLEKLKVSTLEQAQTRIEEWSDWVAKLSGTALKLERYGKFVDKITLEGRQLIGKYVRFAELDARKLSTPS